MAPRHPNNAPGPFYVEADCCLRCGIPWELAPELFGRDPQDVCFVARQPGSAAETDRMLEVLLSQELECIRYEGSDPEVVTRLAARGRAQLCDDPRRPWWAFWRR